MPSCRRSGRLLLGAAALLAASLPSAGPAVAQANHPSGPPGAERFRLTLKALRAVIPAVQGPAASQCEKQEDKRDPFTLTLAEMTATLEGCAPIRAELATIRDVFAHVLLIAPQAALDGRTGSNFLVVASAQPLAVDALRFAVSQVARPAVLVDGAELDAWIGDAQILTDDYAPVDQLLGHP